MKNLRSIRKNSEDSYEYFRVADEEAKELVESGSVIYISREEYKRQSRFFKFTPCKGTIINVGRDENGDLIQKTLHNLNFEKSGKPLKSTKIAKCSSVIPVYRKNKYLKK
jgi:hypothetical protein